MGGTIRFQTCHGATLLIRILLPLRGRSMGLANTLTYPNPSHPALLHKDTTLHGAPTMEDSISCRQNASLRYTLHGDRIFVNFIIFLLVALN